MTSKPSEGEKLFGALIGLIVLIGLISLSLSIIFTIWLIFQWQGVVFLLSAIAIGFIIAFAITKRGGLA